MSSIAITTGSAVTTAAESSPELQSLAKRIKERDRLAEGYAHAQWLENGRDLLKAKALMPHGDFGGWCERALSYSPRTAQKLMRAAELYGPYLENEPGSHLPKPTLIYELSAPSVSQELRDAYVPRLIAGEDVATELRDAIQECRAAATKAKEQKARLAAESPEAQAAQVKREAAEARRKAREVEQRRIEQERQAVARSAALALVLARLGDDLPELLELLAEAGSAKVFDHNTERELHARARAMAAALLPVTVETGIVLDVPEVADAETITTPTVGDSGKSVPPSSLEIADEEQVAVPVPGERAVAATPAAEASVSPSISESPPFWGERQLKFKQSRG